MLNFAIPIVTYGLIDYSKTVWVSGSLIVFLYIQSFHRSLSLRDPYVHLTRHLWQTAGGSDLLHQSGQLIQMTGQSEKQSNPVTYEPHHEEPDYCI